MRANVSQLPIAGVCAASLRVLGQGLPVFLRIAAPAAAVVIVTGAVVAAINWGVSPTRAGIDPRVFAVTTTPRQFAVIAAGILVAALALSYAAAATIHAAAEIASGRRIGVMAAIARVRSKSLQLFWLQWVVNILAVRFSPIAALVLWLLIAPAIPLAVLEDAGPVAAVERTFDRLRGNHLRMFALQLLLLAPVLIIPAALVWVMLPGQALDISALSPLAGLALAFPIGIGLLLPVLLLFIALTLAYQRLAPESSLHAEDASNVK